MACQVSLVDPAVPDWDFVPVPTPSMVPLLYYMNGPIPSRRVMMTLYEKGVSIHHVDMPTNYFRLFRISNLSPFVAW